MTQKRLLTEREIARIEKVADALAKLRSYYYEDEDDATQKTKNTPLQIDGNGSVLNCIEAAECALDLILQEYY